MMSLKTWLDQTNAGLFYVRSDKLKAVDQALGRYEKSRSHNDKRDLETALMAWMKTKKDWQASARNANSHAVESLFQELFGVGATVDGEALRRVKEEEVALVNRLFRNQKLTWRHSYITKMATLMSSKKAGVIGDANVMKQSGSAAYNLKVLTPNPGLTHGVSGHVEDKFAASMRTLEYMIPADVRSEVLMMITSLIPDFMKELAVSMTPFVGVISAGGSAVVSLAKAHAEYWQAQMVKDHINSSIMEGSPVIATQSIIRLLERNRNANLYNASVSGSEFAGKLAGVLLDGGTMTNAAVGLAANLAKLLNLVRIITRDVQEKEAANRFMCMNTVDITVFNHSPILGAYFVCCVPTSLLVNQLLDRFGYAGFQQEVESAVKAHVEPLRLQARLLIRDNRFMIPALEHFPGVLFPTTKGTDQKFARDFLAGRVKPDPFLSGPSTTTATERAAAAIAALADFRRS